jgi:hypothetical protein
MTLHRVIEFPVRHAGTTRSVEPGVPSSAHGVPGFRVRDFIAPRNDDGKEATP